MGFYTSKHKITLTKQVVLRQPLHGLYVGYLIEDSGWRASELPYDLLRELGEGVGEHGDELLLHVRHIGPEGEDDDPSITRTLDILFQVLDEREIEREREIHEYNYKGVGYK